MKEAGYSGIKYKSNKGKGKTYNYVIFDPNDIIIVSKKRLNEKSAWSQESIQRERERSNYEYEDFLKTQGVQQNEAFSVNEQPQTIEQPSETQNAPLVSESNTQQQEQKVETPKVELQPNQTQIADNVIATIDNITLPDGENGFKVTVSDLQGNLIEDKRGDSEFEFSTQEDVDKFINQKQRGYKLEPRKNIKVPFKFIAIKWEYKFCKVIINFINYLFSDVQQFRGKPINNTCFNCFFFV